MTQPRTQIAALLLATAAALPAQTPTAAAPSPKRSAPTPKAAAEPGTTLKPPPKPAVPYINHNLIFLDPAHGGPDTGAHLSGHLLEKDITLALADRIRTLLAGNNLSVLLAREADAPVVEPAEGDQPAPAVIPTPTPDQRAGAANHAHPVACILLHATASGNGVHIVTSALPPPDIAADLLATLPNHAIPWESAQTDSIPQSLRLANEIGTAVARANLPVHLSRASVKPIDSLTRPAVAIEIAPLLSGPTLISDPTYQQRVAEAIATALLFWRGHADPPSAPPPADPAAGARP